MKENQNKRKSMRTILIDYVNLNGPATWTELNRVVKIVNSQPLNRQHYGSCYLDNYSKGVSACLPSKYDKRILVKKDGLYHVDVIW